jgi:hypothetical protein
MPITSSITCTSVTNITQTGANITVNYNANGNESSQNSGTATAYIQYSTSASFPNPIEQPVGQYIPSTGVQTINHTFVGLTPNTTYYYRGWLVANYPTLGQSAFSNVCSFKTLDVSTPTFTNYTCVAPTLTCDSAQRQVSINPKGIATSVVTKYGTATGVYPNNSSITNLPAINGDQNYFINITGLLASTKYFYVVQATNADGVTTSTECNFTTPACPIAPPTTSINCVSVSNVGENNATVTGSVNGSIYETFLGSGNVTVYTQYSTSSSFPSPVSQTSGQSIPTNSNQVITDNISGLSPNVKYYYRLRLVGNYPSTVEVFSNVCDFTTLPFSTGEFQLPGSIVDCDGLTNCNALLKCGETTSSSTSGSSNNSSCCGNSTNNTNTTTPVNTASGCVCVKGTRTITLGNFPINEAGVVDVTGMQVQFTATGQAPTASIKVYAYNGTNSFLIGTQALSNVEGTYGLSTASQFGNAFDANVNNVKIKVEITDACLDCIKLKVKRVQTINTCPEKPKPCCGTPGSFPVFTLSETIEKDSQYVTINDFRLTNEDGTTKNIESVLNNEKCGHELIVNRGTRDRGYGFQEVYGISEFYRISDNQVTAKITRKGIAQYAPYASLPENILRHEIGSPVELYYGASWQASHAVYNCGDNMPCYTKRLEYCGTLPAPAPTSSQYVMWSDIQNLLSGTLPPISCATQTASGLVQIATFNEVTEMTPTGLGECPQVLTTENTGAIFYLGHTKVTNGDVNNVIVSAHAPFTATKCGVRGTFTPTSTNTGAMNLTVNNITFPLTVSGGIPINAGQVIPQKTIDFIYNCSNNTYEVIAGLKDCCGDNGTGYKVTIGSTTGGVNQTGLLADWNGNTVTSMPDGFEIHYVSPTSSVGSDVLNVNNTTTCPIVTNNGSVPIKANEMLPNKVYELVKRVIGNNCYWVLLNPELQNDYNKSAGWTDAIQSQNVEENLLAGKLVSTPADIESARYIPMSSIAYPTSDPRYIKPIPAAPFDAPAGMKWVAEIDLSYSVRVASPTDTGRIGLDIKINPASSGGGASSVWYGPQFAVTTTPNNKIFTRRLVVTRNGLPINQKVSDGPTHFEGQFYIECNAGVNVLSGYATSITGNRNSSSGLGGSTEGFQVSYITTLVKQA